MAGECSRFKIFGWHIFVSLMAFFVLEIFLSSKGYAECLSLKSGGLVFDVEQCVLIQPERAFDLSKEKYRWINDLDGAGRKSLMDSYRGLYLRGLVVTSQIQSKGILTESQALMGQKIATYIAPGTLQCGAIEGKRLSATLVERCCDGTGNAPCLLETSYVLQNVSVLGHKSSAAGDANRLKAKRSKDYQAGDKAYIAKDWNAAVKAYEKAKSNSELDLAGHYKLGFSYRMLDRCSAAIPSLKYIHEQREKGSVWTDEESLARAGEFLLARCYAKMNQPGAAVLILSMYLLEPKKYAKELKDAVSHKDFGWIHTSREYVDFEKEARKKLSTLK
jgi:hypothetical protein